MSSSRRERCDCKRSHYERCRTALSSFLEATDLVKSDRAEAHSCRERSSEPVALLGMAGSQPG